MSKGLFRFGTYLLDGERLTLTRAGEMIATQPKVVETLLALVENHGQVVSKEDLMDRLWPDIFVEEANLKQNIYVLRRTLGEETNQPRYIETIPKRGYRFVAEVNEVSGDSIANANPQVTTIPTASAGSTDAPRANEAAGQNHGRRNLFIVLAVLILVVSGLWFYFRRSASMAGLTEKDTILLADFENRTNEPIFDGMLEQALAIQLQQSPFLSLFPEPQVRQTMREMNRPPDAHVVAENAREICERHNLKAWVAGVIAPLGSHYVVSLETFNGQSGEVLAREQVEAESREQVLQALSQAATHLRQKLGESLSSIQRFDKPLEQVTTSKLEAFKAWSLGIEHSYGGRPMEAIPFYRRAVELDPEFAEAYSVLAAVYWGSDRFELASEAAEKGYRLRDRVNEYEKLRVTILYHSFTTGNLDKRIEWLALQRQTFPRERQGPTDLAFAYIQLGKYDEAVAAGREAIRINPTFAPGHRALGWALLRLNRFAEAKEVLESAQRQKMDALYFHALLYQIAFAEGDTTGMQQQIDWVRTRPYPHVAFEWQTGAAVFAGQWRRARELSRRSLEMTARGDTTELAAQYATEQALRGAVFGACGQTGADAAEGLNLTRGRVSLRRAALALALCNEGNHAQSLVNELSKRYPEDTVTRSIWLPAIRAALELQRGNATRALEQLQPSAPYEAAAEFWPQYLRGQAYLKLGRGSEAATEFQQILGHRSYNLFSPLYPLANLGLARAAALTGDKAWSRRAYEKFFAVWKEADSDLPILHEAKQEYEALISETRRPVQYGVRRPVAAFDLESAVMEKSEACKHSAALAKTKAATSRRTPNCSLEM